MQNMQTDQTKRAFSDSAWQVLRQIHMQPGSEAALQTLVQQVGKALNADRCFVIQFKDQAPLPIALEYRRHRDIASFIGITPPWDTCPYLKRTACKLFVAIEDVTQDESLDAEWKAVFQELGIRGMMASPIVYGEATLNVIVIHNEVPRHWQAEEQQFVQMCADQLAAFLYREQAKQLRQQAQKAAERYEAGIQDSREGLWEWQFTPDSTWWNNQMERILGVTLPETLRSLNILKKHTHPEDQAKLAEALNLATQQSQPGCVEFRYQAPTGDLKYFALTIRTVQDDLGNIAGLAGTLTDLTTIKTVETALQESELRFKIMADAATVLIAVSDPAGRLIFANKAMQEFVGCGLQALIDGGWSSFIHPEDRDKQCELHYQAVHTRQGFTSESRVRRHDGQYRWLYSEVSPRFDTQGQFLGLIASTFDITDKKMAEQALQQSEERFRSAFAYASVGMAISDLEGNFLKVNPAFCDILGYQEAELLQTNFRLLTHPEDLEASLSQTRLVCTGAQSGFTIEKRYIKKDETVIWSKTSVSKIQDHAEKAVNLIAVIEDITERKRTEQALLESEERFRAMADSAPLFIWLSKQNGMIQYVNKTWTQFLGLSAQEVIEFGMRDAVVPEDFEISRNKYREAFSMRKPFSLECRIRRADGEIRWLLNKGAPLFLPDGDLAGYIGTSIDITDRKEVEEQQAHLLSRERLLRQVVEIINESFDLSCVLHKAARVIGQYFQVDRCYIVRYQQDGNALDLTIFGGYQRPGISDIDMSDFPPEMIKLLTQDISIEAVMQIQQHHTAEAYHQDLEKRLQTLEHLTDEQRREYSAYFKQMMIDKYNVNALLSTSIQYRGTPYGKISFHQCQSRVWSSDEVALLQDISTQIGAAFCQAELYYQAEETAKKEQQARHELEVYAKKLENSNRELEQFATIASHDLQEPLRKVQIFSQMAASHCNNSGREYIDRMQAAVTRMQNLITDLLALSRISRKAQPFRKTNITHCIHAVLSDLEVRIKELDADIQISSLHEIDADPKQMEQLFLNLIGNSLKFHRTGVKPVIQITGCFTDDPAEHYEITLRDNGIGFKDQYQDRIFEPFERLHERSQKYPGTGMGLTICRKIVERHGGTITAHGIENEGSTFIVTLPIRHPETV
jgi:PAS domain S-box-containing protein